MLQAVLGGLAGVAVVLKMFGSKIKRALLFWKKTEKPAALPETATPDQRAV